MVKIEQIEALGTRWWFELFDVPDEQAGSFRTFLTDRLTTFDASHSRFLPDSLIGQLNTTGALANPPEELTTLLTLGQQLYRDTDGVFNFLSAHQQVAQGYGQSETVAEPSEQAADPSKDLIITPENITLTAGAVDLGGFGKGWLIDSLAQTLETQFGLQHFLINGGGDMYATSELDGSPVEILIEHPTIAGNFVAKVPLRNQGFAASSTHKRQWEQADETKQHIIKDHAEAVASHVVADSALTADVFATLACAVPPAAAPTVLSDNHLEYLMMVDDQAAYSEAFEQWLLSSQS